MLDENLRVPRTWKGVLFVGKDFRTWCCAEDEGLALRSRPAVGGFKPPHAALAEDRRGERCGKGARDASGRDRKDGAQSP